MKILSQYKTAAMVIALAISAGARAGELKMPEGGILDRDYHAPERQLWDSSSSSQSSSSMHFEGGKLTVEPIGERVARPDDSSDDDDNDEVTNDVDDGSDDDGGDEILNKNNAAKLLKLGDFKIADVAHTDRLYDNLPDSQKINVCINDWERLKRLAPKKIEPIRATMADIGANAQRAHLNMDYLSRALGTYIKNQERLPRQRYLGVVDYSMPARSKRLFIIDLQTGKIESFHVSSGTGSVSHGKQMLFSNESGTLASSRGCYVVGHHFPGHRGQRTDLRLHGIEASDDRMCLRDVYMHTAPYASYGHSWGCPAIDPRDERKVYPKLEDGALVCAYNDNGKMMSAAQVHQARQSRWHHRRRHHRVHKRRHHRVVHKGKHRRAVHRHHPRRRY